MGARSVRVGVSGSYGGFNLGDEAILHVILAELGRALPVEVTVFSRNVDDTRARHAVARVVALGTTPRAEAKAIVSTLDLLILGGGGILYDADAELYLREVFLAHEVGTPVMVYAVSVGPLADLDTRTRVRDALDHAAAITVRDQYSRQLLEQIGVHQEVTVTADPATLLEPDALTGDEIRRAEAIDPDARLIGFSVREPGPAAPDLVVEHYHHLLANAADFMVNRVDAEVVFVPLEQGNLDVQYSHAVVGHMNHAQRATVLKGSYSPGQLLSLLGHFDFAVGMRLHFLIFSALAGVPFVALPYAAKVAGFMEDLQIQNRPLKEMSAGELLANIDRAWDQRHSRRRQNETALRDLQARARRNTALVLDVLERSRGAGRRTPGAAAGAARGLR